MTTTTSGTAKVTLPGDNQILITREFNAPRHLVWRAYTTPELVRRWWAGDKGKVTAADIDLRVGGAWRYVMEANGGFEVAFRGEYREIDAPDRLVHTEIFEGLPDPDDHVGVITTTLTEKDGRTHMEMLCAYRDQADRDAVIASGMEGGMQESLDHLEKVAVELS
ncbi:SRPBCC family protein [Jidongwangia harbinensis]|uniref:SRPBCC family protein n=1 Tax=Jidongwangia harbinensis TaxID=2878561 RepID=UPI001CD9FF86|nr:SRPBCC family protein [Jidongwangia harbinensis]MCA2218670.1 SRPBCC family protein [Jidongwangia harbinensis]